MKKFWSLFKASTKGELNIFKVKSFGKFNTIFLVWLVSMLFFSCYTYAEVLAEPLHKVGLTYVSITMFALVIVLITITEVIYKSQGILFDARDDDLLFSMPIKKSYILITRFIKMLVFTYLVEGIVLIPCLVKYVLLVKPDIIFYLLSILFFFLLPLIPLVIGCILGYIIKALAVKFKSKKFVQTTITLIFFICILFISSSMEGIIQDLVNKATSINDLISKIYLPIGLYINLILDFDFVNLICLVLISVIPFIIFIILFSYKYDSIIKVSKENSGRKRESKIKSNSIIKSLFVKELKTYFSIPPYIINTIISPIMILLFSGYLLFKFDDVVNILVETGIDISVYGSYLYLGIMLALLSVSSITACSISLEGKKFSLLKSLPIREKDIFLSKILVNDLIMIPFFLIGAIVFIIRFEIYDYNMLFILLGTFILPHINGQLGLLINLTFPKMEFNSEIEVVKQSMAVAVMIMGGMLIAIGVIYSFVKLMEVIDGSILIIIYMILSIGFLFILDLLLNTYGVKKFKEIN